MNKQQQQSTQAAGCDFSLGERVTRAAYARPYKPKQGEARHRPLRIYTLDPSASRLDGAIATVNVPYEKLKPGPKGKLFLVEDRNDTTNEQYEPADLNDRHQLITDGFPPSLSDPRFHQQMVYAVCSLVHSAFRRALGRDIAWGYRVAQEGEAPGNPDPARLRIRPHAFEDANAYYDQDNGELAFGYFRAGEDSDDLPGGIIFTALSHDIIAHEVTHALLDGLRAHFFFPSNRDVPAFHEAFADLVAVFQHFTYREVLTQALKKSGGKLEQAKFLTGIAGQFGRAINGKTSLRTAIDFSEQTPDGMAHQPRRYAEAATEAHELGSVLVAAVFEVFLVLFKRKTDRYLLLATNGSGILPAGQIPYYLIDVLAEEASDLATQIQTMCIRAIDLCPPVDIEFGDFLRAVITADCDLTPDDPWAYREAWITAFRRRGIYPEGLESLSEETLCWKEPRQKVPPVEDLSFSAMRFDGDPSRPAGVAELERQARAIGALVTQPALMEEFGIVAPGDPRIGNDTVTIPSVESVRLARRAGPDGVIVFDLVAEVTQCRTVNDPEGPWEFYGGATIILDPSGRIRYVISKSIASERRLERARAYAKNSDLWHLHNGKRVPKSGMVKALHAEKRKKK
ncbi:MAG: peptidase M4 [Chlorobi bacterium]|nr:peptidase M4 [Chlorobiota bacterium]MBX7217431.1 peptidase M4 [Candidatus Kapabacteria bacterium]